MNEALIAICWNELETTRPSLGHVELHSPVDNAWVGFEYRDTLDWDKFWEQRATFLMFVLVAEGETIHV